MKAHRCLPLACVLVLAAIWPTTDAHGITCAQGSRFSGWAGSQFCPTCSALTARDPSTAAVDVAGQEPSTHPPAPVASGAGRCTEVEASAGHTGAIGPAVALLVADEVQQKLMKQRPDAAAALAMLTWNGQRSGLIRDDEIVLSFLGSPTTSTVRFMEANGPTSAFDETFTSLPEGQWLRVSIMLRQRPSDTGLDAIVLTTLQERERIVSVLDPIVLSGAAVTATLDDAAGVRESFLAVELDGKL